MNGETTRAYGERLADQMAYLDRLVQETSGHQRGIGCCMPAKDLSPRFLGLGTVGGQCEDRFQSNLGTGKPR
jgi:hypothetical protein